MKLPENVSLILHGFALALSGATAIVLYILGFTQLYIGGYGTGAIELAAGVILFAVFYARILPYLNRLADWFGSEK